MVSPGRGASAVAAVAAPPPELDGLLPGVLPVTPSDTAPTTHSPENDVRRKAATATWAASVRGLTAQAIAFYFRAPVKSFFRTRVDYIAHLRELLRQQHELARQDASQAIQGGAGAASSSSSSQQGSSKSTSMRARAWLRGTTPFLLSSAVRHYGFRMVGSQVVPPLAANVGAGAVLYTSYLAVLGSLHAESGRGARRVYPPPEPWQVMLAGAAAGAIQSVVAAPLDAVMARYERHQASAWGNMAGGKPPESMLAFAVEKLREIGLRGIFAGWGMSFVKDSVGCSIFFGVFEYVKAQGYYQFVKWYYGKLDEEAVVVLSRKRPTAAVGATEGHDMRRNDMVEREYSVGDIETDDGSYSVTTSSTTSTTRMPRVITPHYTIEPMFLLLAGISASVAQQVVIHPISHMQVEHWKHLEELDERAKAVHEVNHTKTATTAAATAKAESSPAATTATRWRWGMLRAYYHAYQETWQQCRAEAAAMGGISMRAWLYRGFWWNTIRQVPSTSAGLIIFELVRKKYGLGGDTVKISSDGYDIILS